MKIKQYIGKNRKSIIFYWVLSFMLITIAMIVLNILPYMKTSKVIREYTENLAMERMDKAKQRIDSYFEKLLQITWQVSASSNIHDLAAIDMGNDEYQSKAYFSKEILRNLCKNYSYIDNIYVYVSKRDIILTTSSIYNSNDYFNVFFNQSGFTKDMWKDILRPEEETNITAIPSEMGSGYPSSLVLKTTINFYNSEYMNIMISFNRDELSREIMVGDGYDNGELFVFSENHGVLNPNKTTDDILAQNVLKYIKDTQFHESSSLDTINSNGESYTLIYFISKTAQLKIAYALPYIVMWDKLINTKIYFFVILLISLVFCILTGTIFSILNYRPISRLLNKFSGNADKQKTRNEYSVLDLYISNALSEKSYYKHVADSNEDALKKYFIEKLLLIELKDDYVHKMCIRFDMDMTAESHIVIFCYLRQYENVTEDIKTIIYDSDRDNFNVIVDMVINEFANRDIKSHYSVMDGFPVFLITSQEGNIKELINVLSEVFESVRQRIYLDFSISGSFYVSKPVYQRKDIPRAYKQSVSLFQYALSIDWNDDLYYSNISNINEISYSYSLMAEQKLLMCIKSGDAENSKAIIDEIYNENTSSYLDDFDIHCLMYELSGTLIKAVKDINCKLPKEERIGIIERLSGCSDISSLKHELFYCIDILCTGFNHNSQLKENGLCERVIEIIEQNFTDPNFNVTSISDQLEMNLSYISRYFKEKSGEKLIEYITNKRISMAKNLLMSTNESSEVIAKKCGFGNVRTFNRVFLSVVGQTSSIYRKSTN